MENTETRQQHFVITSLQVWDIEIGSTIKNTALEISKKNKVLYVNTPMDYITWFHGGNKLSFTQRMDVIKGRKPLLRRINQNLWVLDCPFIIHSINRIPNKLLFNYFNKINNKKIANLILKIVNDLGFHDFIHLIDTDIYRSFYLKEYLKPAISIYYRRDYVIGESYWKKHGTRLEPLLCQKSDIVITNSLHFANELRAYNHHIYDIETGVNLELYNPKQEIDIPSDIAIISHPIIGYVGSINHARLDDELILYLVEQRPQYNFVFVGPEDDFFRNHKLHEFSNVHFLGNKQVKELPAYIAAFDVCVNPQRLNEITIGNYPLKIDEYLAMGKPVVATKTHTMEHIFKEYVLLATSVQEYTEMLDKSLTEIGNKKIIESRIQFASSHSWQASVNKIYHIINDMYK